MEFNLPIWKDSPETPITAEKLNEMVSAIQHLLDNRSQVGDIVCNGNLDTEEKVIERFGGVKWERIEGRFLLGASDSYEAGSTGGEEKHVLTVEEMPSHGHAIAQNVHTAGQGVNFGVAAGTAYNLYYGWYGTESVGSSDPHNNMPPYEAVYIWKRTE